MAGLTQVLKELMRKRRLIIDRARQQSDASPAQRAAAERQARQELAKTDEQIAKVKSELDAATPESLEWGPDAQLDELMERYRSGQPYEPTGDEIRPWEMDSPARGPEDLMERRARQRHPDEGQFNADDHAFTSGPSVEELYLRREDQLLNKVDPYRYGKMNRIEMQQQLDYLNERLRDGANVQDEINWLDSALNPGRD